MRRASFVTTEYTQANREEVRQQGDALLAEVQAGVTPLACPKATALLVLSAMQQRYRTDKSRVLFRAMMGAIRSCQLAGATTQEISRAQQG